MGQLHNRSCHWTCRVQSRCQLRHWPCQVKTVCTLLSHFWQFKLVHYILLAHSTTCAEVPMSHLKQQCCWQCWPGLAGWFAKCWQCLLCMLCLEIRSNACFKPVKSHFRSAEVQVAQPTKCHQLLKTWHAIEPADSDAHMMLLVSLAVHMQDAVRALKARLTDATAALQISHSEALRLRTRVEDLKAAVSVSPCSSAARRAGTNLPVHGLCTSQALSPVMLFWRTAVALHSKQGCAVAFLTTLCRSVTHVALLTIVV